MVAIVKLEEHTVTVDVKGIAAGLPSEMVYWAVLTIAAIVLGAFFQPEKTRFVGWIQQLRNSLCLRWAARSAKSRAKRLTALRSDARQVRILARSANRRALLRADADRQAHNFLGFALTTLAISTMLTMSLGASDRFAKSLAWFLFIIFIELWKWPRDKRYRLYRAELLVVRRERYELAVAMRDAKRVY